MASCSHCGTALTGTPRVCPRCGAKLATLLEEMTRLDTFGGRRTCPACGRSYGGDYDDTFCLCGTELAFENLARGHESQDADPTRPQAALHPSRPEPERPPAGTRCLVLYGPERQPLHYFPLTKDVIEIGRLDAVAGCFPDIDVSAWLDEATARKVSRAHALILHARGDHSYHLRPLSGNTGTQIDTDMVPALTDHPLRPGTRVVLGGTVRFKFEIM